MHSRSERPSWFSLLLVLVGTALSPGPQLPNALADHPIPAEEFTLPNGLHVMMHEDHRYPFIAVNVQYRTGIINEPPGYSGISAVIDSLMWRWGGQLWPYSAGYYLSQNGSSNVGSQRDLDTHSTFELIPKINIETALWVESERMSDLLPNAWEWDRETVPDLAADNIVKRQESQPYLVAYENLWHALFPISHPYHFRVVGSPGEIRKITLREAEKYYDQFYSPNNATLVVAGDFQPSAMRSLITDYFGDLSRRKPVSPSRIQANLPHGTIQLRHNETLGTFPVVTMAWLTPAREEREDAMADFIALLLVRGRVGRLNRLFEPTTDVFALSATRVSASGSSVFIITVAVATENVLATVNMKIEEELRKIREEGVTRDEIDAIVRWDRNIALEHIHSLDGKASLLQQRASSRKSAQGEQNPLHRFDRIMTSEVSNFVRNYLGPQKIVQYITPQQTTN